MLVIMTLDYKNHTSLIINRYERSRCVGNVEIHGRNRQEIAMAVLNNYPMKLSHFHGVPSVIVDAGKDEEELMKLLERLQALARPMRRDGEYCALLENPTLERLKAFLPIKKLLEGR